MIPARIDLSDFRPAPDDWRGGSIAVGNFDGAHLGHVDLIRRLRRQADDGRPAIAVTFDPHPVAVLRPSMAPTPLAWAERKVELLLEAGATGVAVFRAGPWLLGLSAREFFDRVAREQFGATGMVEGPTFGFGRDREGTVERLAEWCGRDGLAFEVAEPVRAGEVLISSSAIRRALAEGDLAIANAMLGRPHRLRGLVVRGEGHGRTIGYPTANLGGLQGLVPADGVYAAIATIEGQDGRYRAATHIGANSTFGQSTRTVEPYILDFSADLYGREIDLDLVERLRPSLRFDSLDSLLHQMKKDVEATARLDV